MTVRVAQPEWSDGAVRVTLDIGERWIEPAFPAAHDHPPFRYDGTPIHLDVGVRDLRAGPADFELPLAYPLALTLDCLELSSSISPRLLAATRRIGEIYSTWHERFSPVAISATTYDPARLERAAGVGCFFSGGVDSYYTLLRNRDAVTHMIFVPGLDILPGLERTRAQAAAMASAAAAALGKELVEVETNAAEAVHPFLFIGYTYVPTLAAIAHLLGDRLGTALLPAQFSYAELPVPWGGTPVIDPLWGSERVELVHAGAEARRIDKVAYLARSELAMRTLRVCWVEEDGVYNCGRCEKCLRTMLALHAVGALERCATLPSRIDADAVASLELRDVNLGYARENRAALERAGKSAALVEALREAEMRTESSWFRAQAAERRAEAAERRAEAAERRAEAARSAERP